MNKVLTIPKNPVQWQPHYSFPGFDWKPEKQEAPARKLH